MTGIAELMGNASGDKHDRSRPNWEFPAVLNDDSVPREHKHLMFVMMLMVGGVSAGGHLELAHREIGRAIGLSDEVADFAPLSALHRHILERNFFKMHNFHGMSPL